MAKPIVVITAHDTSPTEAGELMQRMETWKDYHILIIAGAEFDLKIYSVENDIEETTIEALRNEVLEKLNNG